jgi:hypothetical protein
MLDYKDFSGGIKRNAEWYNKNLKIPVQITELVEQ